MFGADVNAAEILDRYVPAPGGAGDWAAVLRDASVRPRRRLPVVRAGLAAAAALGAALTLVLAWPFGGSAGPLERALAATGGGPVLHVVLETHPDGAVVDLATGRREQPTVVFEQWYEPGSQLRERVISADGGADYPAGVVVQRPSYILSGQGEVLAGFIRGYRDALQRGDAVVSDHGRIGNTEVTWVRFGGEGGTYEVAVADDTGKPVYLRLLRGGEQDNQYTAEVKELGSVAELPKAQPEAAFGVDRTDLAGPDQARGVMTRPTLWLGQTFSGMAISRTTLLEFSQPAGPDAQAAARWKGVDLVYGGRDGAPAPDTPFVEIEEQTHASLRAAAPPQGSILVRGTYGGELQKDGVYMLITASSEQLVLEAARALQRLG